MRSAGPAGLPQLSHQIDRGAASDHDVPVGAVWGALWSVCDCAEFQYPDSDPAAVFLCAVFVELGAVFAVWAVSLSAPLFWKGFCYGGPGLRER